MKETFSSHFCLGSGAAQTPPAQPDPKDADSTQRGVGGAGAQLPILCHSQAWAGPPRGSFLVSSVVTSPAGEALGVPDTQSTTWGTNLEMEKQIKLK